MTRLVFAVLALSALSAQAQEPGAGPAEGASGSRLTFGGLVQTQFKTTTESGAEGTSTELIMRRVRLGVDARINSFVSGRIQPEFAGAAGGGGVSVNEAYLRLDFHPAFAVVAGKAGRPYGRVDAAAASALVPIERGARFGEDATTLGQYRLLEELAYAGRSVGVHAEGTTAALPARLSYTVGYFSGTLGEEGPPADIDQVAGRVQADVLPGASVGLAYTSRAFGDEATGASRRGAGYAMDVQYGTHGEPGPKLLAEYAFGTFDPFADVGFRSFQGWAAWRFALGSGPFVEAVEPLFRVSWGDLDGGPSAAFDGVLLTPGVNVYAGGNSRLMLNLDVFLFEDDARGAATSFKAQAQVAF